MLPEYVKYYYDKLPENKRKVYIQMYNGLRKHKRRIIIQTNPAVVDSDEMAYIFRCLYNDTPSFYYVDFLMCKFIRLPLGYIFIKDYLYSDDLIAKYDQILSDGLQSFKKQYIGDTMTDYEKEMVIHDFLVRTVSYDSMCF